jgi:hypothetical protein
MVKPGPGTAPNSLSDLVVLKRQNNPIHGHIIKYDDIGKGNKKEKVQFPVVPSPLPGSD